MDVEDFGEVIKTVAETIEHLKKLEQRYPPPPADELAAARDELARAYGRLLSALEWKVPPAAAQQEAEALAALAPDVVHLLEEVQRLELQRQVHADRWPSAPLPQGFVPRLRFALWRVLLFTGATCLIDVYALLGFPLILFWGRVLLAAFQVSLLAGVVLRCLGVAGVEALSAPAAVATKAVPDSAFGWLLLACVGWLAFLVYYCDKDLPARVRAEDVLQRMAAGAAALRTSPEHVALPPSLHAALVAWADQCAATQQRDSARLAEIQWNVRVWEEHPVRGLQLSARRAARRLKAIFT